MQIAIGAVAAAQAAIDGTVAYVKERKVFGQPVAAFQNTRYTLAELQTEVQIAQVFVDKCTELVCQDKLDTATASMAKYWCSDLQCKVMDECVQLFGGYGYMGIPDYPCLCRCTRAVHLWRYQRDHERGDFAVYGLGRQIGLTAIGQQRSFWKGPKASIKTP